METQNHDCFANSRIYSLRRWSESGELLGAISPMRSAWSLRVVIIALLVLIFHLDVSPDLRIAGIAAELPLGLAIAAGLTGGVERGAYFGFFFGFLSFFLYSLLFLTLFSFHLFLLSWPPTVSFRLQVAATSESLPGPTCRLSWVLKES